ncbi:MAG: alpha/beta hydrolase [Nocardioidaceae bacterium]
MRAAVHWRHRMKMSVEESFARSLLRLPHRLLRMFAGRGVVIDGQTLDVEMQAILRLQKLVREPGPETLPISEGREAVDRQAGLSGGRQPIGVTVDCDIDGPGGGITVRLYTPRNLADPAPLLVFFHGGAWIYGGLDSHDPLCRVLAEEAKVRVLAVNYRLAPEHPFPAAVDDALAAYAWARENHRLLGVDVRRIAVGGDSAGGNLATIVAAEARVEGAAPCFQLLIYPATDLASDTTSMRTFASGFYLTQRFIDLGVEHYVGSNTPVDHPRVSPLHRDDLAGVCPAYIATAGFDPLRDEGEAYAKRLRATGVPVELHRFDGMIHGFANIVGLGRSAPAAVREIAAALARGVETPVRDART